MSSTNVDAFLQFAADGSVEKVKQCLDKGNVHIDSINPVSGYTALIAAAWKGHEKICMRLAHYPRMQARPAE